MTLGANAILTVGNASNTTYSGSIGGSGTSGLIKQGSGTLTLTAAETYTGATTVSAGTLQTAVLLPGVLAHRWSFDNSLADSVGGSTATLFGDATLGANSVTSAGNGSSHVNYVSLGTNLLPTTDSLATIEFMGHRKIKPKAILRILDFGSGNGGNGGGPTNLFWVVYKWHQAFAPARLAPILCAQIGLQPVGALTDGTEYHMALVFTPSGVSSEVITSYLTDLAGNVLNTNSVTINNWIISDLNQVYDWLGRSEYNGDNDANASWDEVRIWDTALTQAQLVASAVLGPDAVSPVNILPTTTAVSIASGATLDLDGNSEQIASLSDSGGGGGSASSTARRDQSP